MTFVALHLLSHHATNDSRSTEQQQPTRDRQSSENGAVTGLEYQIAASFGKNRVTFLEYTPCEKMLSRVLRPSAAVRRAVQYQAVRGFAEPVGTRARRQVPGSDKSPVCGSIFVCFVQLMG